MLRHVPLAILVAFVSAACAEVVWEKRLPPISLPDKSGYSIRPSVFIGASYILDLSGENNLPWERSTRTTMFKELVERVSRESTMFSRITLEPDEAKDTNLTIKLQMVHSASTGALMGSLASGATLGLIPGGGTEKLKLTAKVIDRNLREIGAYELEDAITSWLGPLAAFRLAWAQRVLPQVAENMLKNLYQKMLDDKLLTYQ